MRGIQGKDPDLLDTTKYPIREYQRREVAGLMICPKISKERWETLRIRGKVLAESQRLEQKTPSDNVF
jgi:hypothetical protein